MNTTPLLFKIEDTVIGRPFQRVAPVVVGATEDDVTGVAGIALFGELLDHLGLVDCADRHDLRPIGPGGYTGGECYRPVVELQLAGGDFISDVSLLEDHATQRLRGSHALPSHTTLYRFLAGADLGRVAKAMAVNRAMLRRAWAMGAAPKGDTLTIDVDATYVDTYGRLKEGSTFSYKGETQMSPLVGVCGETGDVLGLRARAGKASPRKKIASFVTECVQAIPKEVRGDYRLWVRADSAGHAKAVVNEAIRLGAVFTITCSRTRRSAAPSRRWPATRTRCGDRLSATRRPRARRSPRCPTTSPSVTCA